MNLYTVMQICDAYARLGGAVQEQLQDVVSGAPVEDQNANALKMIRDFLTDQVSPGDDEDGLSLEVNEIATEIDEHLANLRKEEEQS